MREQSRSGGRLTLHGESLLLVELYTLVLLAAMIQWFTGGAVSRGISFVAGALLLAAAHLPLRNRVRVLPPRVHWSDGLALAVFVFIYLSRMTVPDLAWDTENYHIYAQDSLLRDPFQFDYFPVRSINLNMLILGELFSGAFRHLLGYRLGTVYTLLILIVAYFQIKRLLRQLGITWREGWVSLGAAVTVLADGMLLLMGCYYVDTLSVPLILEALLFLTGDRQEARKGTVWLGYLAGMAVSLKASNAYLVIPLAVIWLILIRRELRVSTLLWTVAAAVVPLALFLVRGWVYSGNPLFPYANGVFKSPWFFEDLTVNEYADFNSRFGPETWQQALLWPFYVLTNPHRMSDEAMTTGRLAVSFLTIPPALILGFRRKNRKLWGIAALYVLFDLIYLGPLQGYLRYIVVLDLLGTVMTLALLAAVLKPGEHWLFRGLSALLAAGLLCQTGVMIWKNQTTSAETAERMPLLADPEGWMAGWPLVLQDRGETVDPAVTGQADVWIAPVMGAGYEILIDPNKPLWGIGPQVLSTPESVEEQLKRITQAGEQGLRLWCAVSSWYAGEQVHLLNKYGFRVVNARPVHVSFTPQIDPMMLECVWAGPEEIPYSPAATTWTIIDTDLYRWDRVTVGVCMSGTISRWQDPEAYGFIVELLDADKNLVERLDNISLTYGEEAVQLHLENLTERGVKYLRLYPEGDQLPGALLIIEHDGELTEAGYEAWLEDKARD